MNQIYMKVTMLCYVPSQWEKKLANPIQCACVSVLSHSAMFYPLQPHGL